MQLYSHYKEKYGKYLPVIFFLGGFLFDVFTAPRIDQEWELLRHAFFLLAIAVLLFFKVCVHFEVYKVNDASFFGKIWRYRVEAVHFFIGALLSAYMIFYFKSGSIGTSFVFLVVLLSLLIANEWSRFQRLGFVIQFALFSLCLLSYLIYLIPILIGKMGIGPFLLSVFSSGLISFVLISLIIKKTGLNKVIIKQVIAPVIGIKILFVFLYFMQWIPPVPLSLKTIGIYHHLEKEEGKYILSSQKPWWSFWTRGSKKFEFRQGDNIYCFTQVFAPTRFSDEIFLRWQHYNIKTGWMDWDRIPMTIAGGREEGFRAFAFKQNYAVGQWRVFVESQDGREIGRTSFEVIEDRYPDSMRVFAEEIY